MPAPRATRFEPAAYAALRIVSGALFWFHGAQKILGWFAVKAPPAFGSQLWVGGVIELIGGALITLGLFTRCAAFVCSGTMAVAYTQFHWKLALGAGQWLPIVNKGELAVVYCFVFLYIWTQGPGVASLDSLRRSVK
ncbi:MAG TPA: DoxX family protein [Polyangiaceae bacterium]|nr:DoxX family protein [Polyangiaceae bacterium]